MIPVRAYLRLLIDYLRPQRARVLWLTILLIVGITLQLVNPQFIRTFIDRATSGGERGELIPLAIWFMVIAVAHQGIGVVATYLAEHVGWIATNEMRADLAAHVVGLDMGFHKSHTPGELIERIDGDVTSLSNFFSAFTIRVLGNTVLIAGILALLWRENRWVGLGLTLFSAVALFGMLRIQAFAVPLWKQVRARSAQFFGFVGEQLDGTEDIQANGGAPYMIHRFTEMHRAWLPEAVRARMGFAALWGTSILVYLVGTALVFWLGSLFFANGTLTLGSVYLVFAYTEMMRHPMEQIRTQMEDFQKAGAGIARIEALFARVPDLDTSGTARLPSGPLAVELDDVSFAYEDETVLHELSLRVEPERVLGVLGRSGSGKTTLARLLTRLYDPVIGEVRLGGVPATDAVVGDLRRHVGMVTQDVQLFGASIRDNLTFFDTEVSDEDLTAALDELGLLEWVTTLPHGLATELDAGGSGLSAGQGQLLAFTRIFLENPGLVILDEASSRLDPATEHLIEQAVDRLLAGRTGIIIAHRLATVNRADDILILDDGRIAEYGARARLAADPDSRLSRLLVTGMEEVLA